MPVGPVSENRAAPWDAKEIRLLCPHGCTVHVMLPYKPTALARQTVIRDAIDEHRRVCPGAPSDDGRVYSIDYPRI
jgi:hypothetical protein